MNFSEALIDAAAKWPQRLAVRTRSQEITFHELLQRSGRMRAALEAAGVTAGERVAMITPNALEFVEMFFAAAALPCTLVPIDANLKPGEIADLVGDVKPALLTAIPGSEALLEQVTADADIPCPAIDWATLLAGATGDCTYPARQVDPNATAVILYTSGTVGGSKGVQLSYDALGYSPIALEETFSNFGENLVFGLPVPISHIVGPFYCGSIVRTGGCIAITERFAPRRYLEDMEYFKVTFTALVPPMIQALMQVRDWQKFPLRSLRWMCSFGAMASMEVLKAFRERYPEVTLTTGYGLTETAPLVTLMPEGHPEEKFGSVGQRLAFARVEIMEEGQILPPQELGEIVISGPMLMQGYWNRPDFTAEIIRNGWFHTGDIGRFDEDGYLWIVGRSKDIINVAGLKVFAPEVEDVLYGHPAVEECAVIPADGGLKGETVKAVVKLKDGAGTGEKELIAHCRERLAEFKVPRHLVLRSEPLPRSRTGKIAKEVLKQG